MSMKITNSTLEKLCESPHIVTSTNSIIHFKGQVYGEVVKICLEGCKLFEDELFEANKKSIGKCRFLSTLLPICWKRPREISQKPHFMMGSSAVGIKQGQLMMNCWFISAVSGLVRNKALMKYVTPSGQSFGRGYCGVFRFRFYQHGQQVEVVVDDRLPFIERRMFDSSGRWDFLGASNRINLHDYWICLIEKAYAKLKGGYCNISFGRSQEAYCDLADGVVERAFFLQGDSSHLISHIQHSLIRGSMLTCLTDGKSNFIRPNGIVENHAYSIHRFETVLLNHESHSLILAKNPWANSIIWNGKWSWNDPVWKMLSKNTRANLGYDELQNTGYFWIQMDDLFKEMLEVEIWHSRLISLQSYTNIKMAKSETVRFHGVWIDGINAPFPQYESTYWRNPKLVIKVENPNGSFHNQQNQVTPVWLQLAQLYRRYFFDYFDQPKFHFIQIRVYKFAGNEYRQGLIEFRNNPLVLTEVGGSGPFSNTQIVTLALNLEAGYYAIFCCVDEIYNEVEYILTIKSGKNLNYIGPRIIHNSKINLLNTRHETYLVGNKMVPIEDLFKKQSNPTDTCEDSESTTSEAEKSSGTMTKKLKKLANCWSKFKNGLRKGWTLMHKAIKRCNCFKPTDEDEEYSRESYMSSSCLSASSTDGYNYNN